MNKNLKAWFSFSGNGKFIYRDEVYFDLSHESWKEEPELKYRLIFEELKKIKSQQDKNIVPYFNHTLASDAKKWKVFTFYLWGMKFNRNSDKCPQTVAMLEKIPGLISAAFSIMDANTDIKPHHGDSNIMMRCHLGLKVPSGLPQTGIDVNGEQKQWEEGKLFAFCDAQKHVAWNHSSDERWVLIFDVLRPEFRNKKNIFNAAMTGVAFLQFAFQKFYIFNHVPAFLRTFIMYSMIPLTWPYITLRNLAGKLFVRQRLDPGVK